MHPSTSLRTLTAALLFAVGLAHTAHAATPAQLLADYSAQAGTAAVPARGQQLFTTRHGKEWSCASCHGAVPIQTGKHAGTCQPIGALAPARNPERFSDPAKIEKCFAATPATPSAASAAPPRRPTC